MEPEPNFTPRGRGNILIIALSMLVAGIGLFFLYFITLGIVGHVIALAVLTIPIGFLHYLIWGRALSAEIAAEREALLRREAEELARATAPPGAIQDITRTQAIQRK